MIRKQLDWVAEASHRVFADTFEIEVALNEVGERAGQQHLSTQLFGQGFETRSHVNRGTDDGEVEPRARPDIAVHDVSDVDAYTVIQWRTTDVGVPFIQKDGSDIAGQHHRDDRDLEQIGGGALSLADACADMLHVKPAALKSPERAVTAAN